jgi:NADH-quinone oxidoreductase subunit C
MTENTKLIELLKTYLGERIVDHSEYKNQLMIEVAPDSVRETCFDLRDIPELGFDMLMDIGGIDYLQYGCDEWQTEDATLTGFSRGVMTSYQYVPGIRRPQARFALAYQLLSIKYNWRLRLKVFLEDAEPPLIDSVIRVWQSADWYEREAFDLYGILFKGHPDLRRILTDYGFTGHPFRKDFPMIGNVEMRYDATLERCIYEPVSILDRTLVPKVVREDHRYLITEEEGISHG